MPYELDKYIEESKHLFEYMIHNYKDMFDGNILKHFDIWYTTWWMQSYYEEVSNKIGGDIQTELVPWIRNEMESGRLIEPKYWKLFHDSDSFNDIYIGYKKLFFYKYYYFQLTIESTHSDCIYCERKDNPIHFQLALYGWKDKQTNKVQPYNEICIEPERMMPEIV